jgi:hypothetical protein
MSGRWWPNLALFPFAKAKCQAKVEMLTKNTLEKRRKSSQDCHLALGFGDLALGFGDLALGFGELAPGLAPRSQFLRQIFALFCFFSSFPEVRETLFHVFF